MGAWSNFVNRNAEKAVDPQAAIKAKLAAAEASGSTTGTVKRDDTDTTITDFQGDYVAEYGTEDKVLRTVLREAMEDTTMSYQDMWDRVYTLRLSK